ncbi:hypothetical protein AArcSl_1945 [Halalkaliarchaeum desulfuricum]|uniref:Uncharacterized protein n=1 Tax=Halalkaliarchaeum desulfuricum TaxID=2055893 RepID=A0A343TKE8_9EURY|nr:hypothetical protein [Halalkaliarchaeum desulfuricum]AUX09570.1 hypothetical protein AArcSl_1945 [Halalkaliarchaeum desulfuricum]
MASDQPARKSIEEIEATIGSIKKMLVVGAVFAGIGYLLIGMSLFLELTQFHPLLENFFNSFPETSLAGGGAEARGGELNTALAAIHKWPSTLMWLKLGGVGHILVGIFIALGAIVRALGVMPHRLSHAMAVDQE